MGREPLADKGHSYKLALMVGLTPQYSIAIPPSDNTYDQLEFLPTCAIATTQLSMEDLLTHFACL